MSTLSQTEQKQWNDQRSLLLDYIKKNHKKNWLSRNIDAIISETGACAKRKLQVTMEQRYTSDIKIDVGDTGMDTNSIKQIVASLPGSLFDHITISKQQPPQHGHNKSSRDAMALLETEQESCGIHIYDPREEPSKMAEAICHSCLQAHTRLVFPHRLQAKTVDSINKSVNIPGHEFLTIHKDLLYKSGRAKRNIREDKNRALLASFIQTVYNAPKANANQSWQDAGSQALMGMQFLDQQQSERIIAALEEYFQELESRDNINLSINLFQKAKQSLVFTGNISRIIALTSKITDKGMRAFIKRWLEQLDEANCVSEPEPALTHRYAPSCKSRIALNDAGELGSNITRSLRIGELSPTEKRITVNDLMFSIRRFNDMWSVLDSNEKKYIKPKLMQIIHSNQ